MTAAIAWLKARWVWIAGVALAVLAIFRALPARTKTAGLGIVERVKVRKARAKRYRGVANAEIQRANREARKRGENPSPTDADVEELRLDLEDFKHE